MSGRTDWFAGTLYPTSRVRTLANDVTCAYLDLVHAELRPVLPEGAWAEISGSLGRREAALRVDTDGGVALASDVDVVAVVPAPDAAEPLLAALDRVRHRRPDVEISIYTVLHDNVSRMSGGLGSDRRGPDAGWSVGRPRAAGARPVGPRSALELLVHQLVLSLPVWAGPGASVRGSGHGLPAKLLLEACRSQLRPPLARPLLFADVARTASTVSRHAPIEEADVRAAVRARELSLPGPSGVDVRGCVTAAIGTLLGARGDDDLVPRIGTAGDPRAGVLHAFQQALLLWFVHCSDGGSGPVRDALNDVVSGLPDEQLHVSRDAVRSWCLGSERCEPEATTALLSAVARDYYHYLGPKNYGEFPDTVYENLPDRRRPVESE